MNFKEVDTLETVKETKFLDNSEIIKIFNSKECIQEEFIDHCILNKYIPDNYIKTKWRVSLINIYDSIENQIEKDKAKEKSK